MRPAWLPPFLAILVFLLSACRFVGARSVPSISLSRRSMYPRSGAAFLIPNTEVILTYRPRSLGETQERLPFEFLSACLEVAQESIDVLIDIFDKDYSFIPGKIGPLGGEFWSHDVMIRFVDLSALRQGGNESSSVLGKSLSSTVQFKTAQEIFQGMKTALSQRDYREEAKIEVKLQNGTHLATMDLMHRPGSRWGSSGLTEMAVL